LPLLYHIQLFIILSSFRDLEKAVEDLSELLESPIDPETISTLRQKVTDKTVSYFGVYLSLFHTDPCSCSSAHQVYVAKRNEILLRDTSEGFAEERWKWNIAVEGFD
jgi:ariadne-1